MHHLRVAIEETSSHKQGGYEIRLVATVPSDTIVVKRKGESVKPLLIEAFDTLGLQLKEHQRKRRDTLKAPEAGVISHLEGVVKKVFPFESYGFIMTPDGREFYFHENALKDLRLDQMNEGDSVCFGEGRGDKGPTATWVKSAR